MTERGSPPALSRAAPRTGLTRHLGTLAPGSKRIDWVANYFQVTAYIGATGLVAGLLITRGATLMSHPFAWTMAVATLGGWWWTGKMIGDRRRTGGWMALCTLVPLLAAWVSDRGTGSLSGIVIAALGVLAVLTAWRELR